VRRILTVGHGTLSADEFTSLLRAVGVTEVVDIRSYPGSRHNPQYGREEMSRWLPMAGIGYTWLKDLGGRRRPIRGSRHTALRHPSFQAYADHMETEEFRRGVDTLLDIGGLPAVMCSESVWWRCHRRLLADHLVLVRGVEVIHLMQDGRQDVHVPSGEARRDGELVVYDQQRRPS
jgi:uncharacterized protein (DUF488 family)